MGKEITNITENQFYDLIKTGKVFVGDKFRIPFQGVLMNETVFSVDGRASVDTMIEFRTKPNIVGEVRYVASSDYRVDLGFHERGSKEYHSLLEALK